MSMKEIYRTWYQSKHVQESKFTELWTEVAECLGQPAGLLRPQDRFREDVGRAWITTDELDELYERAMHRGEAMGLELDPSKLKTIDDYIVVLSQERKTT